MNNKKLQKNIEETKSAYSGISLSAKERQTLRINIFEKIDNNVPKSIKSPFFNWSFYAKATSLSFAAFVIFTAPIIAAAERSLPGEFLYEVKVGFNEEVVDVFVSKEEKQNYKKSLLTKRAFEIKTLSEKGELNNEQIKDVEKAIKNSVSEIVAVGVSKNKTEEDIIKDHKDVIAVLEYSEKIIDSKKTSDNNSELHDLRDVAQTSLRAHVKSISDSEEKIDKSIENLIEDARKIIENIPEDEKKDWKDEEKDVEESEVNNDKIATTTIKASLISTTTIRNTEISPEMTSLEQTKNKLEMILYLHEKISEKKVELDVEKLSKGISL